MKVFKMNDCDWVCAESELQAKEFYYSETGFDRNEIEQDFVGEVSLLDATWVECDSTYDESIIEQAYGFKMRGYTKYIYLPFATVIKHEKITNPCIIASTEY